MDKNRRHFIQKTGILATATGLAPQLFFANTDRTSGKLGVALVGLGYYSTEVLAPALQLTKHCELRGIVTGSPEKVPLWQKKYGIADKNVYSYDNFNTIANNPDIDVVYVVLPPGLHAEYAIKAAETGKHVWCEKPMARTVAECEAMIQACKEAKVKLAIGYRCQHDPNVQFFQKMGKTRPFGLPKMISCTAGYVDLRTDHWKQNKKLGGGVMGDMGVYALQSARMVTGEEPIMVSAQASTTRPEIYTEVEETMSFQLTFPSGTIASCQSSFGTRTNNLHVAYEKGWLKMDPHSAYSGNKGKLSDGTLIDFALPNQQAAQMDNDARSIIQDTSMLVPGEEGLRDIRVIEAIYRAAKNNCSVAIP